MSYCSLQTYPVLSSPELEAVRSLALDKVIRESRIHLIHTEALSVVIAVKGSQYSHRKSRKPGITVLLPVALVSIHRRWPATPTTWPITVTLANCHLPCQGIDLRNTPILERRRLQPHHRIYMQFLNIFNLRPKFLYALGTSF